MIKILKKKSFVSKFNVQKFKYGAPDVSSSVENKIKNFQENQPLFVKNFFKFKLFFKDRLIFFDPDVMATLPRPLQMFDPIVEATKVK